MKNTVKYNLTNAQKKHLLKFVKKLIPQKENVTALSFILTIQAI